MSLFFIFGLSGVGKTTFVENVCADPSFYLPRQLVTRAPRADDNPIKYEYVKKEKFEQLREKGSLLIGCEGYGYKKSALTCSGPVVLYGLPMQLEVSRRIGFSILIQGDAAAGLQRRGDSAELREQRERINRRVEAQYYGNPLFRKKMDLILTNRFGQMEKMVALFKRFALFKNEEKKALGGNAQSLLFVLEIYRDPIEGMSYRAGQHLFWVRKAFKSHRLSFLFYSKVLNDSRHFLCGGGLMRTRRMLGG